MLGHATRPRWRGAKAWAMAGLLAISFSGSLAAVARADEVDDLREEVEQLKQQVLYLQNQIPGASAGYSGGGGGNSAAEQEVRMQQFQNQLTELTGQIERVELKVNEVADQLQRMQKDTEYRLGALEGTGGTPMVAAEGADQGQGAVTVDTPGQQPAQVQNQSQPAPQVGQPGVLGTLSAGQAANLPQAPTGAAEDAASRAAQQTAMPSGSALPGATPREQYEYATGLVQRGAYDQAEIALKTFVAQHPNDELTGNAQYWLGETYYARGDFKNAAVAFAEGYQKYSNSAKAPDNLLKLAMALGQQGQKDNACVALRQLEKRYPDASANIKDRAIRAKQKYNCG
jgi:tol-pal system protein YbgF